MSLQINFGNSFGSSEKKVLHNCLMKIETSISETSLYTSYTIHEDPSLIHDSDCNTVYY